MEKNHRSFLSTVLLKIGTVIGVLALVLIGVHSCSAITKEARYEGIRQISTELDYSSAGDILYEADAKTNGYMSDARFEIVYEGTTAFEVLHKRISKMEDIECRFLNDERGLCQKEGIEIIVGIASQPSDTLDGWEDWPMPYTYVILID